MDPKKGLWIEITRNACVSWLTENPKDKGLLQWEGVEPFLGPLSMSQVVSMC